MTEIDFYTLTRGVQDRLVASFGAAFDPKPIASRRGTDSVAIRWLGAGFVAALLLVVTWWWGLGELQSGLARQPLLAVAAYVLLTAGFALGVSQALARLVTLKGLPFAAGTYLFPANVIDARGRKLRVYPLDELKQVSARGPRTLLVRFGARTFSFAVPKASLAQTVEAVRDASQRMREEVEESDRRFLDPLVPPAVLSPLASDVPLEPMGARWLRWRWLVIAVLGLTGVLQFYVRQSISDERMFAAAQARDDVASYRNYLERGTAHRETVSRVLLPRAELRLAVAKGSVEAVDAFASAYPDTDIQKEVAEARRAALVATFEQAERPGSLAALVSFAERYPKHGLEERLTGAKHAIYARALARYQAKMPKESAKIGEFVQRLIAAVERLGARKTSQGVRGPTVKIVTRRVPSKGMKGAEEMVRQSHVYGGEVSLPSRYLDASHLEQPEKDVAQAFVEAFQRQFDAEIITFAAGEPLDGATQELPRVTVPTVVVTYRVEASGKGYARKRPRCVFVGLAFFFQITFLLPGDEEPLKHDHTVSVKVPVKVIDSHERKAPRGSLETAVYAAMVTEGFAEGRKRYFATWFGTTE